MYCPLCDHSYDDTTARHCPKDGTKLVRFKPNVDQLLGRQLDGRFTISEKLGAGGMGTVYRALQASVGREVAVKVIEPHYAGNRHAAKRFLREAKLASRLSQPNTVGVIDFGQTDDGLLFLVMELLKGRTLQSVLREDGPFSAKRTVRIGVQLCDALDAAHALKIVHRDLKPANIIILDDPPGRDLLKVLDFGLAKSFLGEDSHSVTKSDVVVGTPSYIAPEVVEGLPPDPRTDLYSLGVILYELATGKRPFVANNVSQLFAMHLEEPPARPVDLPEELATAILRLLEKKPDDRFANAAEARAALAKAGEASRDHTAVTSLSSTSAHNVSGLETTAAGVTRPTGLAGSTSKDERPRSRKGLALLALLVVAGGALTLAFSMGWLGGGTKAARSGGQPTAPTPGATLAVDAAVPVANKRVVDAAAAGVTAKALKVTVTLDATPPARVWLDGKFLGETPQPVVLDRGEHLHKAEFKRRGRRAEIRRFKADRDHTVKVALIRTRRTRTRRHTTPVKKALVKKTPVKKTPIKKTTPVKPPNKITTPYLDPDKD